MNKQYRFFKLVASFLIYRNNLKGRDFGQETAQIFAFGANCIAREQDVSENQKDAAKLTPLKTDSSGCFGIPIIYPFHLKVPYENRIENSLESNKKVRGKYDPI